MEMRPYWLSAGSESCSGCTFTHVREVEIRCAGCDRGYCVHCVVYVRESVEWLCHECGAGSAGEG
jgi:hypothetical protein